MGKGGKDQTGARWVLPASIAGPQKPNGQVHTPLSARQKHGNCEEWQLTQAFGGQEQGEFCWKDASLTPNRKAARCSGAMPGPR